MVLFIKTLWNSIDGVEGVLCSLVPASVLLFWSFAGQLKEGVVLVCNLQLILCCFLLDVLLAADCWMIIL